MPHPDATPVTYKRGVPRPRLSRRGRPLTPDQIATQDEAKAKAKATAKAERDRGQIAAISPVARVSSTLPTMAASTEDNENQSIDEALDRRGLPSLPSLDAHLTVLSRKQRQYVMQIVWHGARPLVAREAIGASEASELGWRRNPRVQQAISREMEMLRQSVRPRVLHTLVDVCNGQGSDIARVQAARYLDEILSRDDRPAGAVAPGYVIVIPQQPAGLSAAVSQAIDAQRIIDVTPVDDTCIPCASPGPGAIDADEAGDAGVVVAPPPPLVRADRDIEGGEEK